MKENTERSVARKKICVCTRACVFLSRALHTRSSHEPTPGSSHCQSQHVLVTQTPHLVSLERDAKEGRQG